MSQLILSEVNVKEIKFVSNDEGVLVKRIKADFKKLGPKFGKRMKAVAQAIADMSQHDIIALERDGSVELQMPEGEPVKVDVVDVEIRNEDIPGWLVANEGAVTVALDVTVTEDLRREGMAREIVNRVQNLRKNRDYDITQRINIVVAPSPLTDDAVKDYGEYICRQVLADAIAVAPVEAPAEDEVFDIDGNTVVISVSLV